MSFLNQVSVLILTANEEANLARTLDGVSAFPRVVVVDSESTDATQAIAARYKNVRLRSRRFDEHAKQWNFGLTACDIDDPWVLALDADYMLDPAIVAEIAALTPPAAIAGYRARFRYCIAGRRLRGSLYPAQVVLFRRALGHYVQEGHTQRLVLAHGGVGELAAPLLHDDRKPLKRWIASQQRYAALEAAHLMSTPSAKLRLLGRVRLLGWPAPFLVFVYALLVKGCLLDGLPGWFYALQRALAEIMIALELLDRRLSARRENAD